MSYNLSKKADISKLIVDSYKNWTGKSLLEDSLSQEEISEALFSLPAVVVSHDNQADPIFHYGNKAALDLWELDLQEFLETPSRNTTELVVQEERAKLLEEVNKNGFIDNYSGVRISSTGKRFYIKQATVWNLINKNNEYLGQAASFSDWEYL